MASFGYRHHSRGNKIYHHTPAPQNTPDNFPDTPPVPDRFRDIRHQAEYASFSRVLSCLVNERLAKAYFLKSKRVDSYYTVVQNVASQGLHQERRVGDFIVPLVHKPIFMQEKGGDKLILYLHPEDIGVDAYCIADGSNSQTDSVIASLPGGRKIFSRLGLNSRDLLRTMVSADTFGAKNIDLVCEELANSVENAVYSFENRKPTPTLKSSFIEWEQSLVEGHPKHPMNKMRLAVPPVPVAPPGCKELHSPMIHFVRIHREQVELSAEYETYARQLFPASVFSSLGPEEVVLPVHPLQLPNVALYFPQAILLPETMPAMAQASVRTLSLTDHPGWALKLPIGIKITGSLRVFTKYTTYMAPRMVGLLEKIASHSDGIIRLTREVASATAMHEDDSAARHLVCIIRQDVQQAINSDEVAILAAALGERDVDDVPYVISAFNLNTHEKRLAFFDRYAELYIRGFISPAHKFGFAFEAHAQNVLPIFSRHTGELKGFVVRDAGGIRVHQETLQRTLGEKLDILPGAINAFESLDMIYSWMYHVSIQNHLQGVMRAVELYYSGEGWEIVRKHLSKVLPEDSGMYKLFMRETVDSKCFIRMKLVGVEREAIYRQIPNILLYRSEEDTEWYGKKSRAT